MSQPYAWTYSDYARLPNDGRRYEILEVRMLVTPAPSPRHQRIAFLLGIRLEQYVQRLGLGLILPDVDLLFASGQFLRPDLMSVSVHAVKEPTALTWPVYDTILGTVNGTSHEGYPMFETRGSAAFVTMGELKSRAKQTIEKAQQKPVYLLRDGEPVGGIVSIEMLELLQEVLEERYITDVARQRLASLRDGTDELLDDDDFWARADTIMAARKKT